MVKSLFTDAGMRGTSGRVAKIWRPLSRSIASAPEPPPAERICEASALRVAVRPRGLRRGGQERGRGEQHGDEAVRPSHRAVESRQPTGRGEVAVALRRPSRDSPPRWSAGGSCSPCSSSCSRCSGQGRRSRRRSSSPRSRCSPPAAPRMSPRTPTAAPRRPGARAATSTSLSARAAAPGVRLRTCSPTRRPWATPRSPSCQTASSSRRGWSAAWCRARRSPRAGPGASPPA